MNIDEKLKHALAPMAGQRAGQSFMNNLYLLEPRAYDMLLNTPLDPFYEDGKLWAAVQHIKDNFVED